MKIKLDLNYNCHWRCWLVSCEKGAVINLSVCSSHLMKLRKKLILLQSHKPMQDGVARFWLACMLHRDSPDQSLTVHGVARTGCRRLCSGLHNNLGVSSSNMVPLEIEQHRCQSQKKNMPKISTALVFEAMNSATSVSGKKPFFVWGRREQARN